MKILIADDEKEIRHLLQVALTAHGYMVEAVSLGQDAVQQTAMYRPDLLILDLGLPDMDGKEVVRKIREWSKIPIIILTVRDQEQEKIEALDLGADDYVTKPFRLAELLARTRALLRRGSSDSEGVELLVIDSESRRAYFKGVELHLTGKEFSVLAVLFRERGRVVPREQLMREVWETVWYGSTKTLDMHISVLRRKLGDDAAQPRYITTIRGIGFRLDLDPS